MFKKLGFKTMALAAALAVFTPVMASARDRDDSRHDRDRRERRERFERGFRGRDGCWHRY
jgi:hypothetical protein